MGLRARPAPVNTIELADGSSAEVVDDELLLRDPKGRLLLRYGKGQAEIVAPDGDLRLAAPTGKVIVESATDIELRAARDVVQAPTRAARTEVAGSTLEVKGQGIRAEGPSLEVSARRTRLASREATVIAGSIATSAERLVTEVERYELTAQRLVEKSRDTFRDVSGLLQEKAGRMRTFVSGVRALYTKRTVMVSKKDTSIDGDKILLG